MEATIDRTTLLAMVSRVTGATDKRGGVPILSHLLAQVEGGELRLTGTDMELSVSTARPAQDASDGTTTLPGAVLLDIARKLPDGGLIKLSAPPGSERVTLACGRYRTELASLEPAEFPLLSGGSGPGWFAMPAADLRTLVDRTRSAIASDDARYYLNGMHLHPFDRDGEPRLRAVATDGHRMAIADVPLAAHAPADLSAATVPRKTVAEIRRMLDDDGEPEASLRISATRIEVRCGGTSLTSKLIDGDFPDYARVVPASAGTPMEFDRDAFAAAIGRVAALGGDASRAVAIEVATGRLTITMEDPARGSAREEMEPAATGIDGVADVRIGFQARYLQDIVAQVQGRLQLHVGDPGAAVLALDTAQPGCRYILMPIRC